MKKVIIVLGLVFFNYWCFFSVKADEMSGNGDVVFVNLPEKFIFDKGKILFDKLQQPIIYAETERIMIMNNLEYIIDVNMTIECQGAGLDIGYSNMPIMIMPGSVGGAPINTLSLNLKKYNPSEDYLVNISLSEVTRKVEVINE